MLSFLGDRPVGRVVWSAVAEITGSIALTGKGSIRDWGININSCP